jgi:hypothetical protein
MSAYHVGQDHINALLSYAQHVELNPAYLSDTGEKVLTWAEIGKILSIENDKSVNHRYSETRITPYKFVKDNDFVLNGKAIDVIKMIGCYEYQSCEHPGWENSKAKKFCTMLLNRAITKLPGYDTAIRDYERKTTLV